MDAQSSFTVPQHFGISHEEQKITAAQLLMSQILNSAGAVLCGDDISPKCHPSYRSDTRVSAPPLSGTNHAPLLLDGLEIRHCSAVPSSCFSSPSSSPSASSDPGSSSSFFMGCQIHCHWGNCSQLFASLEPFLEHIRLDHLVHLHLRKGQRKFTCLWTDCERGARPFSAIYMLVQHLRAHTGEKPYKCEWPNCEKCYSRLENLKTHQRKHTGERPYQCSVCERSFTNASDKAKHVNRVHKEKKQYLCTVMGCGSAYTDPSSLRKHTLASHGTNPWLQYKASRRTVRRTE